MTAEVSDQAEVEMRVSDEQTISASEVAKMANEPWSTRFVRQTWALTKKNLIMQQRNSLATFAQLFVGVLFMLMIVLMGMSVVVVCCASSRSPCLAWSVQCVGKVQA